MAEIIETPDQIDRRVGDRRHDDRRKDEKRGRASEPFAMPIIVINTSFILLIQAVTIFVFCL